MLLSTDWFYIFCFFFFWLGGAAPDMGDMGGMGGMGDMGFNFPVSSNVLIA